MTHQHPHPNAPRPRRKVPTVPAHITEVQTLAGVFAMDGRDLKTAFATYKTYSPELRRFMSDRLAAANALLLVDLLASNHKLIRESTSISEHAARTSSALIRQVGQLEEGTKMVSRLLADIGEDQAEGFERILGVWTEAADEPDDEPVAPLPPGMVSDLDLLDDDDTSVTEVHSQPDSHDEADADIAALEATDVQIIPAAELEDA